MLKKLSEIITEMIEPYKDESFENLDKLVSVATCAWNMTVVPEKEGKQLFDSVLKLSNGDEESEKVFTSLIGYFIRFKLENYSNDSRLIINHKFDTSFNPPNLAIASTELGNGYGMSTLIGNKVGRNDPCYCGSGKKYKKCCAL